MWINWLTDVDEFKKRAKVKADKENLLAQQNVKKGNQSKTSPDGKIELMRSWLFVPGHKQRMLDKSLGLDVDAVMLDIEDGVPPAEKELARTMIAKHLETENPVNSPTRFVRINSIGHSRMEADLETVLCSGLEGLVLPKVESVEEVKIVEKVLDTRESEVGLEPGSTRILVAIENSKGLFQAPAIAACSPRIIGLMLGTEDFARDLGLPMIRKDEALELIHIRSSLVLAAASAGVQAVDGVWPDIEDKDGLLADTRQSRCLGFTGKSLFHPSQIEAINAAFSPAPEEIDYCSEVIKAFDEAMARGDGAIAFGGQLIDLPIVDRARRTMALAEYLGISATPSQE